MRSEARSTQSGTAVRQSLAILLRPDTWRIVGADSGASGRRRTASKFADWLARNTHAHAALEFMVALRGRAPYALGDAIPDARPGTIFVFDSMVPHQSGYPPFYPDVEHLWLMVTGYSCTAHLIELRSGACRRTLSTHFMTPSIFRDPAPSRADAGLANLWRISQITSIAARLLDTLDSTGNREDSADFPAKMMAIARQHIAETAGKGISIDSLSKMTGYSKFHFLRLFKRHVGTTVWECVNDERVKKAHALFGEGRRAKEVSDALGFSCPAAFSRWRKKTLR